MVGSNRITLQADTPREIELAAQFVAELQRQGLRFDVTRENVTHLSGLHSVPGLLVEIHGY
jgi:hypothetical protein